MAIVKFVPLVPETYINKWTFFQICIQYYVSLPNNHLWLLKEISDNFHL